ncbi:MAG: GNAT family N-acetyltransferase [Candidatus Babeliales bacterium]
MEIPTITTSRLTLRALNMEDAPAVFAYASDPDVTLFTHWSTHTSMHDTRSFLHNIITSNIPVWGIEHKETNTIIGECGFVTIEHDRAELYYALARAQWNKGFGTEAVHAVLHIAFDLLNVPRIEAWIIADNIASHRVAQKVGMQYQFMLPAHWYAHNKLYDTYIYTKEHHQPSAYKKSL